MGLDRFFGRKTDSDLNKQLSAGISFLHCMGFYASEVFRADPVAREKIESNITPQHIDISKTFMNIVLADDPDFKQRSAEEKQNAIDTYWPMVTCDACLIKHGYPTDNIPLTSESINTLADTLGNQSANALLKDIRDLNTLFYNGTLRFLQRSPQDTPQALMISVYDFVWNESNYTEKTIDLWFPHALAHMHDDDYNAALTR